MKLGILGGGSWGTALALLWAQKGHEVELWVRNPENAKQFREANCNTKYLPDSPFPDTLNISSNLEATIQRSQLIGIAIPLQVYREVLGSVRSEFKSYQKLITLSKGIELKTHQLPSQIVLETLGTSFRKQIFTLSGPSFAKEVAEGKPTTVVLAGHHMEQLEILQTALNCPTFRMYRNDDVVGVELAAALKNVIAIASGLAKGLNLGHNTIAGLITRGLYEMSKLGTSLGANPTTFSGLAGMGDLILTCTGTLSRNLKVGMELAKGRSLEEALASLGMIAEGVKTCRAAYQLGKMQDVELPIISAVYHILYEGLSPQKALQALMSRSLKAEGLG